ncbi:MAG: hypothetical protein FJW40_18435 [Acidobacteria bacterium]|nr:hypothetical protein [Acidobacteriota bacterium]
MPASEARLAANRANASLATGPRTEEGKAISSQNALTHGLTSAQVIIAPGEQPEFDVLLESFTRDLAPQGAAETAHFNDIVHAVWQKRRIRLVEAKFANGDPDLLLDPAAMAQIERYRRYHSYYDRIHHRASKALTELQRNRQLHHKAQAEAETIGESIPADTHLLPPPAPPRHRIDLRLSKQEASRHLIERNCILHESVPALALASFFDELEPGGSNNEDDLA